MAQTDIGTENRVPERELWRREYNNAGRRVMDAQQELAAAIQELSNAAIRLGRSEI